MISRIQFERPTTCIAIVNHQSITTAKGEMLLGFGSNREQLEVASKVIEKHNVPYKQSSHKGMLGIVLDLAVITSITTM